MVVVVGVWLKLSCGHSISLPALMAGSTVTEFSSVSVSVSEYESFVASPQQAWLHCYRHHHHYLRTK